jgi:hypothetical protein
MADKTISTRTRTGKEVKVDDGKLSEFQDHAQQLAGADTARDQMYKEIDDMFLMTWTGDTGKNYSGSSTKIIVSPDARNTILGAVRLMVATDPQINISNVKGKVDKNKQDTIEKGANAIWVSSGRAQGGPIHYDAILSSILYADEHLAITSTADLLESAKQNNSGVARAERLANRTPFLIDVWNPKDGHSEFDSLGLSAYYRKTEKTVTDLKSAYGNRVPADIQNKKSYEKVVLNTYYNNDYTAIWTDAGPILCEPHNLPFIPVVVQQTEGSKLWSKSEESKQPMLYTLLKSGLWTMENMILTVMYTLIKDQGVTPLYVHRSPKSGQKALQMNFDDSPGVVELVDGEDFSPIQNKGLIDPALEKGLDIAQIKSEQSTIYSQALGAPVSSSSTYSELALLSQSGRLPLIGTQRRGGWGIATVLENCLYWMKQDKLSFSKSGFELKSSDIPDYFELEVKLDVKLPQDKLQMANIANILTNGDNPIASKEFVRREILSVGQSTDMDKEIWTEKAASAMFSMFTQQQIQAMMAQQQQAVPQQTPQGNQIPPQQVPAQPQGELQSQSQIAAPQMAPDQAQNIQGMPAQMAGMMPGAGQAAVPPGGE